MASTPQLSKMRRAIASMGGDEAIMDLVADPMTSITDIMGLFGLSRTFFYTWLKHEPGGDQRQALYEAAQRVRAAGLMDQAGTVLDDVADSTNDGADATSAQVSLAAHRSQYRRMLAGLLDDRWKEKGTPLIGDLHIGDLHIGALQAVQRPAIAATEVMALPAEIVEDDDEG